MKHFIISIFLSAIFAVTAFAQDSDFIPGWYIVEKTATCSNKTVIEEDQVIIYAGEVVFAYMKIGDLYFCIGHIQEILIKGVNPLTKIVSPGKLGILVEGVSLMEANLEDGSYFWVTNIDAGTGQATILLNNGQKQNIPSKSIEIAAKYWKDLGDRYPFNNAH